MNIALQTLLQNLKEEGEKRNIPNISFQTGEILQFLIQIIRAKNVLEIGCANGFSTIFLAAVAEKIGGKVVTCDISLPSFREAQKNVKSASLSDIVEFRFGDGRNICIKKENFKFIFIDAQKDKTHEFFEYGIRFLSPDGVICIDNARKFPQKMSLFDTLKSQTKDFIFFDIFISEHDAMTLCFSQNTSK